MTNFYTGFFNNGIVTILLLLIIFASIALLASWIRKILLPETKDTLKVDPLTPKTKTGTIELVKAKKSSPSKTKKQSTKNATKRRSKVS
jgi:biopolymer transport protein ExbD